MKQVVTPLDMGKSFRLVQDKYEINLGNMFTLNSDGSIGLNTEVLTQAIANQIKTAGEINSKVENGKLVLTLPDGTVYTISLEGLPKAITDVSLQGSTILFRDALGRILKQLELKASDSKYGLVKLVSESNTDTDAVISKGYLDTVLAGEIAKVLQQAEDKLTAAQGTASGNIDTLTRAIQELKDKVAKLPTKDTKYTAGTGLELRGNEFNIIPCSIDVVNKTGDNTLATTTKFQVQTGGKVTIPVLSIGSQVTIVQATDEPVILEAVEGVELIQSSISPGLKLGGKNAAVTLICTAANTIRLFGHLKA